MPTIPTRDELLAALDAERAALLQLLPRFDDERWRTATRSDGWTAHDIAAHLADANYGLAKLVLGEFPPTLPVNPTTGWMDPDANNQQRREKNASLPREKIAGRMASAFEHARRAIETVQDVDAPGPYGPNHTKGQWLKRIVDHTREHRSELEALLDER
jgi:uncharacterized damage-inducible protein DinB